MFFKVSVCSCGKWYCAVPSFSLPLIKIFAPNVFNLIIYNYNIYIYIYMYMHKSFYIKWQSNTGLPVVVMHEVRNQWEVNGIISLLSPSAMMPSKRGVQRVWKQTVIIQKLSPPRGIHLKVVVCEFVRHENDNNNNNNTTISTAKSEGCDFFLWRFIWLPSCRSTKK